MSHNQPVSAYLAEFQAGAFLYEQFWKFRETIPNGMNSIFAWFFGHEHKATIYRDSPSIFKARLIGNGAIPHSVQALVHPQKDERNAPCTDVFTMNDRPLSPNFLGVHELDLAVSMVAFLTFNGPDAYIEYRNEDESVFLREKLSGGPNEVLEWGEGIREI